MEDKETIVAPGTSAWTAEPTQDLLPSSVEGSSGTGQSQPKTIREDAVISPGANPIQEMLIQPARSARARRACALRALGLLLADGTPTGGRGEDFLSRQPDFFTETAVTPERKVEKSFPRWEINRHVEG